ncbi:MAG: hypothetical protein KAJ47_01570 [Candidatus Aenigmarchaeota archaeon]|nr:hypothetical protein [Candidatus Aenigmarchaeota archaeon]
MDRRIKKGQLEIMIIVLVLLFVAVGIIVAYNWAAISFIFFSKTQALEDSGQQVMSVKTLYIEPAQKFSLINTTQELGMHGGFYADDTSEAVKEYSGVPYWSVLNSTYDNNVRIPFRIFTVDHNRTIDVIGKDTDGDSDNHLSCEQDMAAADPTIECYWADEADFLPSKQVLVGIAVESCESGSTLKFKINSSSVGTLSDEAIKTGFYVLDMPDPIATTELATEEGYSLKLEVSGNCKVYFKQFVTSIYDGDVVAGLNKEMGDRLDDYRDLYDNPNKDTTGVYSDEWNSTIYPNRTGDGSSGVFWTESGIAAKKGGLKVKEQYISEVEVYSEYWKMYDYAIDFFTVEYDNGDGMETDLEYVQRWVKLWIMGLTDEREYKWDVNLYKSCTNKYKTCSELISEESLSPIDFKTEVSNALNGVALDINGKGHYPDINKIEIKFVELIERPEDPWNGNTFWVEADNSYKTTPPSNLTGRYASCEKCTKDCGFNNDYGVNVVCSRCKSECGYYYAGNYTAEVSLISHSNFGEDEIVFKFNIDGNFTDTIVEPYDTDMTVDSCNDKGCDEDCHNKYCYESDDAVCDYKLVTTCENVQTCEDVTTCDDNNENCETNEECTTVEECTSEMKYTDPGYKLCCSKPNSYSKIGSMDCSNNDVTSCSSETCLD